MIEFADCASLFQHLLEPHINDVQRYGHLTVNLHEAESDEEVTGSAEKSNSECGICNFSLSQAYSSRKKHFETWHQSGQIKCTHCSTAHFRTKWQFAIHLSNQHQVEIEQECRKCEKVHSYYRKFGDGRYYAYHWK